MVKTPAINVINHGTASISGRKMCEWQIGKGE
jgi:hypothetical protein